MAYALDKSKDGETRRPTLEACLKKLQGYADSLNIAKDLDDQELIDKIGYITKREYDIDKTSREEWDCSAERAMDVAMQVRKPKNYPWPNASNIKYPLVTVAALQFGARAYPAIVDGKRVVKGVPLGEDSTGEKKQKADRISQHMSWQLLWEMEEWEEDTDCLLHHLPIVGCAFRKVYRSGVLGRNKAEMVPAIHLVVNQNTKSLADCPRVTHEIPLYPHEIEERVLNEEFLDVDLPKPNEAADDDDAQHWFLEQHRLWDLDGDGYREPYIVTIHKDSNKVVRVVANYAFEDIVHDGRRITRIPKGQYFVKYSFLPDPKGGFYDIGFGKLLESLGETIDTTINQMLDAGTLQNAGGGIVTSGLRMKKGEIRLSPGKYITLEGGPQDIKNAVYNWEHPGPSEVLFELLGLMIEAAKDITAVKDILTGDTGDKGVQTATTTLALIEQGLKVFTAIYKRVYRALADEFWLLAKLNSKYMNEQEYFTLHDSPQAIAKSDYDMESLDVRPVSDPSMVTDMQRAGKAQFLLQMLTMSVEGQLGVMDPRMTYERVFDWMGVEGKDLMPPPQQGPSPQEQLALENALAEIDNTKSDTTKKEAETFKIVTETEMLGDQQALTEFESLTGAEREAENQRQSGEGQAAQIRQSDEQLRQSGQKQTADIALQKAGLDQQERALEQKAEADRKKASAKP